MDFIQRLRPGVLRGEITCSIRIWQRPRVKAGNRYRSTGLGEIEIDSIRQVALSDITPALARESGFNGVVDLLKTAKHGAGRNVYLVRFHHVPVRKSGIAAGAGAGSPARHGPGGGTQLRRVIRIVGKLPGGQAVPAGRHSSLEVHGKRFGWFLADHHGDGRVALNFKGSAELADMLRNLASAHFHKPRYLGNKGWCGLWLDLPDLDWSVVEMALQRAHSLAAPKRELLRGGAPR